MPCHAFESFILNASPSPALPCPAPRAQSASEHLLLCRIPFRLSGSFLAVITAKPWRVELTQIASSPPPSNNFIRITSSRRQPSTTLSTHLPKQINLIMTGRKYLYPFFITVAVLKFELTTQYYCFSCKHLTDASSGGKGGKGLGKGGAKRHRKVRDQEERLSSPPPKTNVPPHQILRDNIQGITKPAIRRLARRGGVSTFLGMKFPALNSTNTI
jgi:hypothetical protein